MKKYALWIVAVLALCVLTGVLMKAHGNFKRRQAKLEEEISVYRAYLRAESAYILDNQLENGAILLYRLSERKSGQINPYFACQAMLGLLEDSSADHLAAVEKYLRWHTENLLLQGGVITDFDYTDGTFENREPDSVDSYAAKYLSLLAAYAKAGGEVETVPGWQEAVEKLMDILDSITLDGCVFTSDSFRAAYLMDNAEVYEGCRDISEFLSERSGNGHAELAGRYSALADKIQAAVEEKFWDSESNAYHIGVSKSGSPIRFQSFEEFYPDAVAQLYPAICRMRTVGSRELELYQGLCAAHAWEKGELSGHTFEWSLLAYAAFVHGDTESLNQYLSYYEKKAAASRDYPMHTANAGWVMLAAGEQSEVLKAELREGFFTYLFSGNWFGESR